MRPSGDRPLATSFDLMQALWQAGHMNLESSRIRSPASWLHEARMSPHTAAGDCDSVAVRSTRVMYAT